MKNTVLRQLWLSVPLIAVTAVPALAQGTPGGAPASAVGTLAAPAAAISVMPPAVAAATAGAVQTTSDYLIGPGDVLGIVFWREQDLSVEVVVRPDGRISIPLINEVSVSGLSPETLRQNLTAAAQKYVQDPSVTVVVKQINSRRVYITGEVSKPGPYPLVSSMNVLQLISTAGGLLEYADGKHIVVMRTEKGKPVNFTFNYKDVIRRKNLGQNIDLQPGDTVVVP